MSGGQKKRRPQKLQPKGPEPDPWGKKTKQSEAKKQRIKNECQKMLDRCWNALPENCPLRVELSKEQFDNCWMSWNPLATAYADPDFKLKFSIILAEYMWGSASESVISAIQKHYEWLLKEGSDDALKCWNDETLACKININFPVNHKLIALLEVASGLPQEESRYVTYQSTEGAIPAPGEHNKKVHKEWEAMLPKILWKAAKISVNKKKAVSEAELAKMLKKLNTVQSLQKLIEAGDMKPAAIQQLFEWFFPSVERVRTLR